MSGVNQIGEVSFWYRDLGGLPKRRAPLAGDMTADVCIVGAGYTGLWSAFYLKQAAPELKIVIVEKEFAGFGASGRNGGWLSGGFAWSQEKYAASSDPERVRAMARAMSGTVAEVTKVAHRHAIDADILATDELMVATNPAQLARMKAEVAHRRHWGEEDRVEEIGADAARARINIPGIAGAMIVKGVARVQPAKLVRGLAETVEKMGVLIAEGTEVTGIAKGAVDTRLGRISAPVILRATEGFTATIPGQKRTWLPLNSAQIVTAPLPADIWNKIGWQGHEIMGDFKNSYCYCQRTREGRIAVGGRGVPYRFGSAIDTSGRPDPETIRRLIAILHRHFPAARDAAIDHAWCGVLGVPRDWCATVGFDRDTGIGWAGGYVGVGVSTSNLAGRTLADLSLGRETPLTELPWVNRRVRNWEPEPLRWLGVTGMYGLYAMADRREEQGLPAPSRLARIGNWLTGR
ncbi:MAG: FAD-binding oxidoreductase [Paracoccaceae bacterium]